MTYSTPLQGAPILPYLREAKISSQTAIPSKEGLGLFDAKRKGQVEYVVADALSMKERDPTKGSGLSDDYGYGSSKNKS
ncbi:hypothetical protein Tco_0782546 [Tanacetum coccineum]